MRNRRFFLLFWVLILAVSVVGRPAVAQSSDGRYFPETNKWVRGEFLKFYLSSPDPSVLFGLPISEEMVDLTGTRVQYFERARFELRMTDKGLVVKLANLGWLSIENEAPAVDLPVYSPTCRQFPAKGKVVCYDFLKFYDKYNGKVYFGEPITNLEERDGGYVQYFENARLEFRANALNGERIKITDLGRIAYIKYVGKIPPDSKSRNIIGSSENHYGIHMHAFVAKSMAPVGAEQTVVVVVHDNQSNAIVGARVSIVLEYPSGRKEALSSGVVDADGIFKASFEVGDLRVNDVVKVLVQSDTMGSTFFASNWFRILVLVRSQSC